MPAGLDSLREMLADPEHARSKHLPILLRLAGSHARCYQIDILS